MCVPDTVAWCDSSVLTDIVTISPFAPIFVQIDCVSVPDSIYIDSILNINEMDSVCVCMCGWVHGVGWCNSVFVCVRVVLCRVIEF